MCDVRKSVVRVVLMGLAAGMLATALVPARAQSVSQTVNIKRRKEARARRETNASREARIARTIQETYTHRYEIIGGGGYLRFRSGAATRKNNEVTWATAFNYYLNTKLALVGDARGSFGYAKAEPNDGFVNIPRPQINEYTFMGGASYRFYAKEKVAFSAQALGGIGWGIFSGGSQSIPSTDLGVWHDGTKPAFSLGVSADYNIQPNFALRFTPTYVATTFSSGPGALPGTPSVSVQNNIGFNVGVIYRFGHQ